MKIIWAVDGLARDKTFQEVTGKVLATLSRQMPLSIEPVSIILRDQVPYIAGPGRTALDFQQEMKHELQEWIGKQSIEGLSPVTVLIEEKFSIRSAVEHLLKHAKRSGADLIVLGTHAKNRDPEQEHELGTFSESLFLEGEFAALYVNPRAIVPERFSRVIFPTDLSTMALRALEKAIAFAESAKLSITLFHKIALLPKGTMEYPHDPEARARFFERMRARQEEELRKIAFSLTMKKLFVDVACERIDGGYVASSILERASTPESLIAMVATTSEGRSSLPGSVTRQILRGAKVPVLVLAR